MFSKIIAVSVSVALAGTSTTVGAAGFALIEQNASGLGNAYAGQAASAQDASTIYFNPAGMTQLPGRQVVGVLHAILPSAKFNNAATTPAVSTTALAGPYALNGTGGDAGDLAFVPNLYLSWQLNPQWFIGVGVNAPFGLKTEYDTNWMGRFHALKSEVKSINVNPSIAYKVNDVFSVGAGLNWQRLEAELTKAVNYSFVGSAAGLNPPAIALNSEGSNKIEASDSAWGFNLGLMFNPSPDTNMGLSYRSAMKYTLSGSAAFFGRPAAVNAVIAGAAGAALAQAASNQVGDSGITANLKLPASYSFAVKHKIDSKWDVLADATRTEWSSIQSLNILRPDGITSLENTPFNWRDTWRVGVGANYRYDNAWTIRGGIAYDQTPTRNEYRTPRVPDQDRTWLSIGAQYKVSPQGAIDIGYAHLFVKNASINMNGPPSLTPALVAGRGALLGNYDNQVNIFSVQYRHNF